MKPCASAAAPAKASVPRARTPSLRGNTGIDRDACVGCMACARACPSGALEACAAEPSIGDILNAVLRDRAFFGQSGGLTLSGGEPLLHAGPVCRLLREAKTAGLHTAVETCGFFEEAWLSEAVPVTDLFLWDFKDSDEGRHLANTGVSLQPILKNLRAADEQGASIRLRCILIRSVNLTREHLEAIAGLYASLPARRGGRTAAVSHLRRLQGAAARPRKRRPSRLDPHTGRFEKRQGLSAPACAAPQPLKNRPNDNRSGGFRIFPPPPAYTWILVRVHTLGTSRRPAGGKAGTCK